MSTTSTPRPQSTTGPALAPGPALRPGPGSGPRPGRRRVPAVLASVAAVGVVLGACSAGPATGSDSEQSAQSAGSTQSAMASSSDSLSSRAPSSSPSSPPTGAVDADTAPVSYPLPAPAAAPAHAPAPGVPTPAPGLPALVVATGGPCHMLGKAAQADDGSALFCTEDPGGAGPLWLPLAPGQPTPTPVPPQVAPGAGGHTVGQPYTGGSCAQEGLAVTGPEGMLLTCTLTGGGTVPGGLYWQ